MGALLSALLRVRVTFPSCDGYSSSAPIFTSRKMMEGHLYFRQLGLDILLQCNGWQVLAQA
eukprot:m.620161 g.620161  ORF g.620161 m.620161 type:complete len:61 (-) comp58206_c2_seq13:1939-2121(-)